MMDLWLLEVELYGRVHKCQYGYKAEKQRVLSVRPFAQPSYPEERCGTSFLEEYARNLQYDDFYSLGNMWDAWHKGRQSNIFLENIISSTQSKLIYGVPRVLREGARIINAVSRSELSGKLGTSVREWDAQTCFPASYFKSEEPEPYSYISSACSCVLCTGAMPRPSQTGRRFLNNIWRK